MSQGMFPGPPQNHNDGYEQYTNLKLGARPHALGTGRRSLRFNSDVNFLSVQNTPAASKNTAIASAYECPGKKKNGA